MLIFLKDFLFNLCTVLGAAYLFKKLLCLKAKNQYITMVLSLFFSGTLSGAVVFGPFAIGGNTFVLAFLLILILQIVYKTNFYISICAGAIAYSFTYLVMLFLRFPLETLISFLSTENVYLNNLICTLFSGLLLFPILSIPFRIQRLRNGMPFLKENNGIIGVVLSVTLLFIITYSQLQPFRTQFIILIVASVTLTTILIIWWRIKITNQYKQKLRLSELNQLKADFAKISQENQQLSTIIHKDNKLIQAILLALHNSKIIDSDIAELVQQMASERQQLMFPDFSVSNSGNSAIDAILSHMYQKAAKNGCKLSIEINSLPKIQILDLSTILADLIENCIHACHSSTVKEIDLYLSDEKIILKDSGTPFPNNILLHLGQKPITSREEQGGQGIGMVTILKILERHQASIQINRLEHQTFSKEIIISFDSRSNYSVPHLNLSKKISAK